ncbi:MAG: hypothetical protein ACE366_26010 [Bradymonadia bacterium]
MSHLLRPLTSRLPLLALLLCLLPALTPSVAQAQMELETINLREDTEAQADLDEALKSYKKRNFLRASLLLHRIVSGSEVAVTPVQQKAEYTLGKTMYRLGLFQASLNYFTRVVQAGRSHRYFKATCKWLYYLSRKLSGDPALLEKIAKYTPDDCPAEFRDELGYLVGQYHYKKGALQKGLQRLSQINPNSQYFPKAKFLEGISHVRLDQPKPAVERFKELLRVTATSDLPSEDLKYFNQLAIMSMARVFYSTGQFDLSVKYYDRVPLESALWLDALFEASWAFFRLNNHGKSLGHLHTLNSPFFSDEYYPEAQILESVIFYANCDYDRTLAILDEFQVIYEPLRDEIKGYLERYADPAEFYAFLQKMQKGGARLSPRINQIVSAANRDKQLRRIAAYVSELEREIALIEKSKSSWSRSSLAQGIIQDLTVTKDLAVYEAGRLAKDRLKRVVSELNELISQNLKIRFEVASARKGVVENRLNKEGFANKAGRAGPNYATDDEHIYWPFNGEYWRDELGYYVYTIQSECRR